jgi:6,7-dimethyl-8-ribityllumazine synthase
MKELVVKKVDATGLKILILHTRWNLEYVSLLVQACSTIFSQHQIHFDIQDVPGCFELPFATQLKIKEYDACVAIGILIKGDTMHFEYISEAVVHGLMRVGLDVQKPVILGVLTCLTSEQAKIRCGLDGGHNHGIDWAYSAMEMALLNSFIYRLNDWFLKSQVQHIYFSVQSKLKSTPVMSCPVKFVLDDCYSSLVQTTVLYPPELFKKVCF